MFRVCSILLRLKRSPHVECLNATAGVPSASSRLLMSPSKRRKGEKPVIPEPLVWSDSCTVARMIRTGTGWLDAWMMQQGVSMSKLSRKSGLSMERVLELVQGAEVAEGELERMAGVLRTDVASITASIEAGALNSVVASIAFEREIIDADKTRWGAGYECAERNKGSF